MFDDVGIWSSDLRGETDDLEMVGTKLKGKDCGDEGLCKSLNSTGKKSVKDGGNDTIVSLRLLLFNLFSRPSLVLFIVVVEPEEPDIIVTTVKGVTEFRPCRFYDPVSKLCVEKANEIAASFQNFTDVKINNIPDILGEVD